MKIRPGMSTADTGSSSHSLPPAVRLCRGPNCGRLARESECNARARGERALTAPAKIPRGMAEARRFAPLADALLPDVRDVTMTAALLLASRCALATWTGFVGPHPATCQLCTTV